MSKDYFIEGPIMVPGVKMLRYYKVTGPCYIQFPKETIQIFFDRHSEELKKKPVGLNHSEEHYDFVEMTESYILNDSTRHKLHNENADYPDGSWIVQYRFKDKKSYDKVIELGMTGFSVEATFPLTDKNGVKHTIHDKFRLMNKLSDRLPFNVHVYGGSTYGSGANEHGKAHFELKEKNTGKKIGKITMPSLEKWNNSTRPEKIKLLQLESGNLPNKHRKLMVDWLDSDDNLTRCHFQWNEINKDNNRTEPI